MNPPNVELVIDRLVLAGLHTDARLTAQGVERELTRLFRERGVPVGLQHEAAIGNIDAGPVTVSPTATPESVGTQVARAVFGGIGR